MAKPEEVMGKFMDTINKHMDRYLPILLAFGLFHKEGDSVKPSPVMQKNASKAGGKLFGIGMDDEAIETSILGVMRLLGHTKEAKIITAWIITLPEWKLFSLRDWMSQKMKEYNEIIEIKKQKHPRGMLYMDSFLVLFANSTTNNKERTKLATKLHIIPAKKPLMFKVVEKVQKIKAKDVEASLLDANKKIRKELFRK